MPILNVLTGKYGAGAILAMVLAGIVGSFIPPFVAFSAPVIQSASVATIEIAADKTNHFVIGPEVVHYVRIFCWVVGLMFAALTVACGGLGFFFRHTINRNDATHERQWEYLGQLRTDLDMQIAHCSLRGTLCPGLRPDILRDAVASALGVSVPSQSSAEFIHKREQDSAYERGHRHCRETNGAPTTDTGGGQKTPAETDNDRDD